VQIEGHKIGKNEPCFIIAEAGTAHEGDLEHAYYLIDAAKETGADCVKFQAVFADEIIHPLTGKVKLPSGEISLYERFKELEKDEDFFKKIKQYAEKRGLIFLCTPFGLKSARLMQALHVSAIKIASPELNHFPLLEEVASYDLPLILSTGVSTLGDIEKALSVISGIEEVDLSEMEVSKGSSVALLHCITAYPAPEEEYNLRLIRTLHDIFGIPIGVSDHSLDPLLIPVLSVLMGACIIEKHFKAYPEAQAKDEEGLDSVFALAPEDFYRMVRNVREAGKKGFDEGLEWMTNQYGTEKIYRILGNGVKKLAFSEKDNYATTRRTIHALKPLLKGDIITGNNIAILRSEKKLRPGLGPEFFNLLLGKQIKESVNEGEGILWKNIL
jgi:N-acetylneuraminate synthase